MIYILWKKSMNLFILLNHKESFNVNLKNIEEFFRHAKQRVDQAIREILLNEDDVTTGIGTQALRGDYPSLTGGIIQRRLEDYILKGKDRSSDA